MNLPRTSLLAAVLLALGAPACGARTDLAVGAGPTGGRDGGGGSGAGSASPACAPGDPPTALAADLTWPFGIAVDATHVYFTTYDGHGAVTKVPKAGGEVVVLSDGLDYPDGIAVDASHVYVAVANEGRVLRMAKDGSGATPIGTGAGPSGIAIDEATVYWTNYVDKSIASAPKEGGSATTLATGIEGPYRIAVDADHVYWTSFAPTLDVIPKGGGAVSTVTSGGGPRSVATHGGRVFWTDPPSSGVWAASEGGEGAQPIAQVTGYPDGIAADDAAVYVALAGGDIVKIPPGGGAPVTLATGQATPALLAVDESCVYWTNTAVDKPGTGSVMRAPR